MKDVGSPPAVARLILILSSESWRKMVGKLMENGRKVDGKLSENFRQVPMPSKYSIFLEETRRINLISMSKKCSVTMILENCVIRSGWRSFPSTLFSVWGFCINRFGIGPLHYVSSHSDFGFEFAEIFIIEKRLPNSPSRGVDKIAYRYNFFQTF